MCCNRVGRVRGRGEEEPWASARLPGDDERRDRPRSIASTRSSRGRCRAPSTRSPSIAPRASGCTRPTGQRILDFNSQLMSVNIGHGDRRVIDAITEQATKLQYVQPAFATEIRARLGAEAGRDPARRHGQGVLHARRRRGDRERHQARPPLHRPEQGPGPLSRLPRRDDGRDDAHRRPAPLGERAGPRRRRPLPGHAPLGRGGAAARWRRSCRASRTSSATRGRTRSRRSSSRRSSARTASSSRPTATSRASARSATGTGSSWSATRSWRASGGRAAGSRSTTGTSCPTS